MHCISESSMRSNDFEEFMVSRDYNANSSSKRHTPLDKSRLNVFVSSRDASGGTVKPLLVIRVENGNARSMSSTQPTWSSSNGKYRAQGANERQEINTLIVTSESENVDDLDKDEFRVSRDFRAYDFNDTRPTTCGEHREQEQNSKNYVNRGPSVSRLSDVSDNTMTCWRVSTSPDDRLSLPSAKRQWDKTTQPLHLTVIISQGRTSKFIAASTCQPVVDLKS